MEFDEFGSPASDKPIIKQISPSHTPTQSSLSHAGLNGVESGFNFDVDAAHRHDDLESGHSHDHHKHPHQRSHSHDHNKHDHEGHHHGHAHAHDMNMHGVFLHILGDFLGTVAVIISTLIIIFCEGDWKYYMDPLISLLITCLIVTSTIPLVKSASYILLQSMPSHLNIELVREKLGKIEGVIAIHELHVWQLSNTKTVASIHVLLNHSHSDLYMSIAQNIKKCLHVYFHSF